MFVRWSSTILAILTIGFIILFFRTCNLEQQLSESKKQMIAECDSIILKINHQETEVDSSSLCGACKQLHLKQKEVQKTMSDYTKTTYPIYKENARLHDQYSTFLTEYAIWTAIIVALITGVTLIIGFLFKYDLQDSLKQIKEESRKQEQKIKKEWEDLKWATDFDKNFNCIRSLNAASSPLLSTPGMKYFFYSMLQKFMDSLALQINDKTVQKQDLTLLLINIHEALTLIDPLMAHDSSVDITHLVKARDLIRAAINLLNKGKDLPELESSKIQKELLNISIALKVEYDTDTQS